MNGHVATVPAVKHLPEVVRQRVRLFVLLQRYVIIVDFVPVGSLDGSLYVYFFGQVCVLNGPGHGSLVCYEISPFLNPLSADQEVGQTSVNVDKSVIVLERTVQLELFLDALVRVICAQLWVLMRLRRQEEVLLVRGDSVLLAQAQVLLGLLWGLKLTQKATRSGQI